MDRRLYKYFLVLLFSIAVSNILLAQDPASITYSEKDGLISNNVYHVMQDSKGYLWICTDEGVSRFNGYEFVNFGKEEGLDGGGVFICAEDEMGRIWFGCYNRSLYYFNDGKVIPYEYNDSIEEYTRNNRVITSLFVDNFSVKIGFQYDGSMHIDKYGNVLIPDQLEGKVLQIDKNYLFRYSRKLLDKQNLVSTPQVTFLYSDTTVIINKNSFFPKGKRGPQFYAIQLNNGSILASSYNLLYHIDHGRIREFKFEKVVDCLVQLKSGKILIGFIGGGLKSFNYHENYFSNDMFIGQSITSIIEDVHGKLWIGTRGNGIMLVNNWQLKVINDTKKIDVTEVVLYEDEIYAGLINGTIIKVSIEDFSSEEVLKSKITRTDVPIHFGIDTYGKIVTELSDLNDYNFIPEKFRLIKNENTSGHSKLISIDKKNDLWIGTQSKGYFISDRIVELKSIKPSNKLMNYSTNVIFEDKHGIIWYGTNRGLFKVKNDSCLAVEIPNLNVIDIIEFDNGLVLSSKENGIMYYTADGLVSTPELKNSKNASSLCYYMNSLFFISDGKIYKIVYNNDIPYVSRINISIPGGEINIMQILKNGYVYIGSSAGLYVINANEFDEIQFIEPKLISFNLDFKEGRLNENSCQDSILFNNGEYNAVEIDFDYTYFDFNNKLKYFYRLLPNHKNWIELDEQHLFVTISNSRNYDLVIKCESPFTANKSQILRFRFISNSSNTSAKHLIFLIFLIPGIFYVINEKYSKDHSYIFSIIQRNSLKEIEENKLLKLQLLFARMNPHFTFNALNSLQSLVLDDEKVKSMYFLNRYSRLLRRVMINSDSPMISLQDEIDLLKRYVEIENIRFNDKIKINIINDDLINRNQIRVPAMLLQPLVENSLKHGFSGVEREIYNIDIIIKELNELYELSIIDNGIGYSIARRNKDKIGWSKGLSIVIENLKILNLDDNASAIFNIGDYFQNGNISGTIVTLKLPKN